MKIRRTCVTHFGADMLGIQMCSFIRYVNNMCLPTAGSPSTVLVTTTQGMIALERVLKRFTKILPEFEHLAEEKG